MNGLSTSGNADCVKFRGGCDALGPAFPRFAPCDCRGHLQPGYARAERHLRHRDVGPLQGRNPLGLAFFEGFDLPELLRATAWRTSALKADSSTSSPSWMSIARRAFPSRLELKRRAGSFRDAPLKKVSFTAFL